MGQFILLYLIKEPPFLHLRRSLKGKYQEYEETNKCKKMTVALNKNSKFAKLPLILQSIAGVLRSILNVLNILAIIPSQASKFLVGERTN